MRSIVLHIVILLGVITAVDMSPSSMQFNGNAQFFCPATNSSKSYECYQKYNITFTYKTNESTCSQASVLPHLKPFLQKPLCRLTDIEIKSKPPVQSQNFLAKDISTPSSPATCNNGSLSVDVQKRCSIKLSLEKIHFLQLCNQFKIRNAFHRCSCEMFSVAHNGEHNSLCNILDATKNMEMQYSKMQVASPNIKYDTILKRSCIFHQKENDCNCKDYTLSRVDIEVNETTNFCNQIFSLKELCRHFKIDPADCHCKLFNFSANINSMHNSVCEFFGPKDPVKRLKYTKTYLLPYAVVETVASIIGIFGNLIVVLIAIRFRRGLATCKKLIAHLALYDLLFAILQLIYAIPRYWTSKFIYNETMCKVLKSFDYFGTFLAIGIILIISVERFIGIVNPFSRGISRNGIQAILAINFVFSTIAIVPLLKYNTLTDIEFCTTVWPRPHEDAFIYNMFILIVYLCIPVIIIGSLYSLIVVTLYGTITFGKSDFIADPRIRQKRIQDNRRTMYVLMSVVVAFVIFVFPKHVIMIYINQRTFDEHVAGAVMSEGKFYTLMYIAHFSYPFHVAINPIIYSLVDARWRIDAKHLFSGRSRRNRSAYSATMTSTMTARRRSSAANVLEDQSLKRRVVQVNNINYPKQLIVTANNGVSPISTPIDNNNWLDRRSTGSAYTFVA